MLVLPEKENRVSNQNADPIPDGSWLYSTAVIVNGENVVFLFVQRIELTGSPVFRSGWIKPIPT